MIKLQYYLAPPTRFVKLIRPLLRLLDNSPEVQAVALEHCAVVAEERPVRHAPQFVGPVTHASLLSSQDLLADHIASFFVRFSESLSNKRLRLRILVALASEANVRVLLNEFLVGTQSSVS